jgi:hypothetical protein
MLFAGGSLEIIAVLESQERGTESLTSMNCDHWTMLSTIAITSGTAQRQSSE